MQGREYTGHDVSELIRRAKHNVRSQYKNNHPLKIEAITILELTHEYIEKLGDKAKLIENLREISLGAWFFCAEMCGQEYWLLSPEYQEGYILNSGSTAYTILLKELALPKNFSEKYKLACISAFHYFVFQNEFIFAEESLREIIQEKNFVKINLENDLFKVMRTILTRESENKKRILTLIPPESVIHLKMTKLSLNYLEQAKTDNLERQFLAKLAVAICKLNEKNYETATSFLSQSFRLKLGVLLYIILSIKAEAWFEPQSVLYRLARSILGESFDYIKEATKIECLTEFHSYLSDHTKKGLIENYINDYLPDKNGYFYIGIYRYKVLEKLNNLIKSIVYQPVKILIVPTAVTILAAVAGEFVGNGIGFAIGYSLSLTDPVDDFKNQASAVSRPAMKVIFGGAGNYLGHFAADTVIDAALEHMLAILFGTLGAGMAAVGCGAVTFTFYKLSFAVAKCLYEFSCRLSKRLGVDFLNDEDDKFINTLLKLPHEVYSMTEKQKLKQIIGKTSELGLLARTPVIPPPSENEKNHQQICRPTY